MNPGMGAETAKAAGAFITVMKDQPLALALVVMNVILLLVFYVFISGSSHRFDTVLAQQAEVYKLLYNCVPADKAKP